VGVGHLFCDRLKEVRKLNNITQAKLASAISMSRQAVIKYESGERFPDEITLVRIANFFGISLDKLLDRKATNKEQLAYGIISRINKMGLADNDISNDKIELIFSVIEPLIREFAK
jgi:transcriptional regulator with XRE-family HTH domain